MCSTVKWYFFTCLRKSGAEHRVKARHGAGLWAVLEKHGSWLASTHHLLFKPCKHRCHVTMLYSYGKGQLGNFSTTHIASIQKLSDIFPTLMMKHFEICSAPALCSLGELNKEHSQFLVSFVKVVCLFLWKNKKVFLSAYLKHVVFALWSQARRFFPNMMTVKETSCDYDTRV